MTVGAAGKPELSSPTRKLRRSLSSVSSYGPRGRIIGITFEIISRWNNINTGNNVSSTCIFKLCIPAYMHVINVQTKVKPENSSLTYTKKLL